MIWAIALALVPTVIWCAICLWQRPSGLSLGWLVAGAVVGVFLGVPVWLLESVVDRFANPDERLSRDFIQQVIGAACSEEILKAGGVAILVWLGFRAGNRSGQGVVAIAISVGIGFMTLENLVAVIGSENPLSLAIDRQLTLLAGHGHYQSIMGVLLAWTIFRRQVRWAILALLVPIFLHGWGDLSEQLFRDEPNPGSAEDTVLFFAWIASVLTTALVASVLLKFGRGAVPGPRRETAVADLT
jgi:RsiW-degrading membrane proteinase PrsW (M82 family)